MGDPPSAIRIDGYQILSELGRGGMGSVYRARDLAGNREVAIKVLHASCSDQSLKRFLREGELTASLSHPGIVRVYASGHLSGRPYLVYEHVEEARELEEVLVASEVLERVELVRDAATALGHAHSQGVVHRDLKPSNMLVDGRGHLRVVDFGVATAEHLERLTQTGGLVGSLAYMAPEQFGPERPTPATDVWALGVILYRALTGRLPFDASTQIELMHQIVNQRIPRPRAQGGAVPRAVEAVCVKALSRDVSRRYQSGDELAAALESALAASPSSGLLPALGGVTGLVLLALLGGALLVEAPTEHAKVKPTAPLAAASEVRPEESDPTVLTREAKRLLQGDRYDPKAIALLERAAKAGHAPAMVRLGIHLNDSAHAHGDPARAGALFERAAALGDPEGRLWHGVYLVRDDPSRAHEGLQLVLRAGEEKQTDAYVHLMLFYIEGTHVPKNRSEAARWGKLAADAGNPSAACAVGKMFMHGLGVPSDLREAMRYFRLSASGGSPESMKILADLYREGRGVAQDLPKAKAWYERTIATRAQPMARNAQNNLASLLLKGGPGVKANREEAIRFWEAAAEAGNFRAMRNLGKHLRRADPTRAVHWLRKCSATEDRGAMKTLGDALTHWKGVEHNPKEGVEWYRRAAEKGDRWAMNNLAVAYLTGEGIAPDTPQAIKWFEAAAAAGHVRSMDNLGKLYDRGEKVPRDVAKAERWYREAIAAGGAQAMIRVAELIEGGEVLERIKGEADALRLAAEAKKRARERAARAPR